jgi:ABC-type phosphonate transport system ATPase subunit
LSHSELNRAATLAERPMARGARAFGDVRA